MALAPGPLVYGRPLLVQLDLHEQDLPLLVSSHALSNQQRPSRLRCRPICRHMLRMSTARPSITPLPRRSENSPEEAAHRIACAEVKNSPSGRRWPAIALGTILPCASSSAQAQSPAQRGLTIAPVNCARCHSIDKVSESPLVNCPRVPHLASQVSRGRPAKALGEGIIANHPMMPQFRFEADQIEDLIVFLKTLER